MPTRRAALAAAVLWTLCARSGVLAQEPPTTADASALARTILDLRDAGKLDDAIARASEATAADPEDATLWRVRGLCHQERGNELAEDREFAIECYARSLSIEPYDPAQRELVRIASSGRSPAWVTEMSLPYLPGNFETRSLTLRDPRAYDSERANATAPEVLYAVSTSHLYPETVPKSHPARRDIRFAGMVPIYTSTAGETGGRFRLRARVYYQTDTISPSGIDRRPEALRIARECAEALAVYDAHVTRLAVGRPRSTGLAIYVMEEPKPAGFAGTRAQVDFWSIADARLPLDWVREVCRSLGGSLLPPVSGFEGDEPLANPDLGEALLMSWMVASRTDGVLEWDAGTVDAAEHIEGLAGSALQAFLSLPPSIESFRDPTADGRRHTVGLALWADSILEPAERASLWGGTSRLDQMDLLTKVANTLSARTPSTIRLPGGIFLARGSDTGAPFRFASAREAGCLLLPGRPVRYRVYLPAGRWRVALAAQGPEVSARETTLTLSLLGAAVADPAECRLVLRQGGRIASETLETDLPAGWYVATLSHDNDEGAVTVRSVTFAKQP